MKKVYLTIDDAPTKDFLSKVKYLHERNIPAIVFCIGSNIEKYKREVVKAIELGYTIGNHSYDHKYFSDMSLDECFHSINKTDALIDQMYDEAKVHREKKYFRFPHFDQGGDLSSQDYESKWSKPMNEWVIYPDEKKRQKIQEHLIKMGYEQPKIEGINHKYFHDKDLLNHVDVRCTFDQMEFLLGDITAPYGLTSKDAIIKRVDEDEPYMGRSLNRMDTSDIILIHDMEHTTDLFYELIDKYQEKKFKFLRL